MKGNECGSLGGSGVRERMDTCVCLAESLCCSPETLTTSLIGYTPIKKSRKKKKEVIRVARSGRGADQG